MDIGGDTSDPILVFDIGGTNTMFALYDPQESRLTKRLGKLTPNYLNRRGLEASRLFDEVLEMVLDAGATLLRGRKPSVVIVGYPGPIDPEGVAIASPTILGPRFDRPLRVRDRFASLWPESRVEVLNDLSCSSYRYVKLGLQDFCILTIGSGIGHKVFLDGHPRVGPGGRGGELGHLSVYGSGGRRSRRGRFLELGDIASGRGYLSVARRRMPQSSKLTSAELIEAYHRHDALACSAINDGASALGHALAAVHVIVGIEQFIIVGGFASALGEPYRRQLVSHAERACWDTGQDWDEMIALETADDDHGLLGAGAFAVLSGLAAAPRSRKESMGVGRIRAWTLRE
jgi:C7-cyclitol 7-kinase